MVVVREWVGAVLSVSRLMLCVVDDGAVVWWVPLCLARYALQHETGGCYMFRMDEHWIVGACCVVQWFVLKVTAKQAVVPDYRGPLYSEWRH